MANLCVKRLTREYGDLQSNPPAGITLLQRPGNNLKLWHVQIAGSPGTLYEGEAFVLRLLFPESYPLEAPEAIFEAPVPVHPHVYSNGHICLSILYDEWSPALNVSSICLSLQSMLSSCTKKERPPGDATYVQRGPKSPKDVNWEFHDDKV